MGFAVPRDDAESFDYITFYEFLARFSGVEDPREVEKMWAAKSVDLWAEVEV